MHINMKCIIEILQSKVLFFFFFFALLLSLCIKSSMDFTVLEDIGIGECTANLSSGQMCRSFAAFA